MGRCEVTLRVLTSKWEGPPQPSLLSPAQWVSRPPWATQTWCGTHTRLLTDWVTLDTSGDFSEILLWH